MSLTQEQVAHIARLSRLSPTQEELENHQKNLSKIVDYVDMLSRVPKESLEGLEVSSPLILPLLRKTRLFAMESQLVKSFLVVPNSELLPIKSPYLIS